MGELKEHISVCDVTTGRQTVRRGRKHIGGRGRGSRLRVSVCTQFQGYVFVDEREGEERRAHVNMRQTKVASGLVISQAL